MAENDGNKATWAGVVGPVVHDLTRPAAQAIGNALGLAVGAALSPARLVCLSFEEAVEQAGEAVQERLRRRRVAPEHVRTPPPEIGGQVIHMLRFPDQDPAIRDLYVNLLASAMDDRVLGPHPALVDIIRQLSVEEARLVPALRSHRENELPIYPAVSVRRQRENEHGYDVLAWDVTLLDGRGGVTKPVSPQAVANLIRLGLLVSDESTHLTQEGRYDALESHPDVVAYKGAEREVAAVRFHHGIIRVTPLGYDLANACLELDDDQAADGKDHPATAD
jgi:hypothetical protein